MTAEALLGSYSKPSLERMARVRKLETKGQSKEALIGRLAPMLFDQRAIRRALAELSPDQRRLLDEVRLLGGDAPTGLVRRRLEEAGVVKPRPRRGYASRGPSGPESEVPQFDALVEGLGAAGLLFSSRPGIYASVIDLSYPGQRLFIPSEVLEHVPPAVLPVGTTPAATQVVAAQPGVLLRDVYTILSVTSQSPLPLTARGQIAKRSLVALNAQLRVTEDAAGVANESELVRLPLLRALLEDLGLVAARAATLIGTEAAKSFLDQPPGSRSQQLLGAYRQTRRWSELQHLDGVRVRPPTISPDAPQEVLNARRRVLAELAELPVGQWILVDEIVERIKRQAYELLFRREWSGYEGYHASPYQDTGRNPMIWSFRPGLSEERGWDLVEGGLIRLIVERVLHWLGVVDVGRAEAGGAVVRITPEGALLLHDQAPPTVRASPHVVIQPNFQLFAFEPTDESVLFTLDQFADRIRAEQVVEYQLTRDSVYRAQRMGLDAAAIVAFLERVSSVALPQNVRRSLEEWGALSERVVVHHRVSLLHAVDAPTLDALYADSQVGPLLGRRLAPTAALVAVQNLVTLRQRLLDGDCLPALSEGVERRAQPAFSVAADGRLEYLQPHCLPDFAVLHVVEQAADAEPDGARRVTMHSLRRAAQAGRTADDILANLGQFHAGPLPPEVVQLVRRWTRHWGRGAMSNVTLLQVESAELLSELLADPEVRPHVRRLDGATTLALVDNDRVACVRSLLEARGMQLADQL